MDALLVPAVLLGGIVGRSVISRIDQSRFERLVLGVTAVTSLNLLR
jgi:uncharacterized membrane protein YfcA